MDKFFEEYADLTAVILAFSLPLFFTIFIKLKTRRVTRAMAVYLLLFGPLGILSFIFFHLFENSYRAIIAAMAGTFEYDFHFYSLILLGVAIAVTASFFLAACLRKCLYGASNKNIFASMTLVIAICAPLLPITPISAVPLVCCVIAVGGVFSVRRKPAIHIKTQAAPIVAAA